MFIIPIPLLAFLNLICIGIDITIFFLICRMIMLLRQISWLEKLNDVGKKLVDAVTSCTGQIWHKVFRRHLSIKGELIVSFIALLFLRNALSLVGSFVLNLEKVNMKTSVTNQSETEAAITDSIRAHVRLLGHKYFGITELQTFNPATVTRTDTDTENHIARFTGELEGKK